MIEVNGKYTNAKIMIDEFEPECLGQIINMISHEAFTNPVRIMPDTHLGKGSVIGFTMPVGDKVIPNVVGVDIACGMLTCNIGKINLNHEDLDKKIRERIPFGINVRHKPICNFERQIQWDYTPWSYQWFKDLCEKVEIDYFYAQCSVGTLGGGNHFVEIGKSASTGDIWITVHSGSRNLGKKICEYWQTIASKKKLLSPKDQFEIIKTTYPKQEWQKQKVRYQEKYNGMRKSELDFLEGDNKNNYLKDMEFASWYARMNREQIIFQILDLIDDKDLHSRLFSSNPSIAPEFIETVHNYIDFKDNIIRKGAIRSYIGEKMIIPFNMRDGILLCEGKSNPDWNFSAPHGAGRVHSRSKAKSSLSVEKFEKDMKGIFSTSVCQGTLDESPDAYKDSKIIEQAIEPTAKILDRIIPIHNLKDTSEEKPWKDKKKKSEQQI